MSQARTILSSSQLFRSPGTYNSNRYSNEKHKTQQQNSNFRYGWTISPKQQDRALPAGRFELVPELLELEIPHVLESKYVNRTVLLYSLPYRIYNRLLVLPTLFLRLR